MNANKITLTTETFADKVVKLVENATDRRVIGGMERIVKSWTVVIEYSREASSRHGRAGYQRTCVLFSEAADLFDEFVAAYRAA
jgi:hypothetical protein